MVSLDHLMDHILVNCKPLPWDQLRDCPIPVRVIATAADDLSAHVLQPKTIEEWQLAMRATSTIPVLAGPPVRLAGRDWIDGSVAEPLPVLRALADGATHVLALVNRTVPDLRRPNPVGRQARWARSLDRLAPGLGSMAQESHRLRPEMAVLDSAAHPSRSGGPPVRGDSGGGRRRAWPDHRSGRVTGRRRQRIRGDDRGPAPRRRGGD